MNQKQRDFLVETIMKKADEQIKELSDKQKNLKKPTMKIYVLDDIRKGTAKIRSSEEIIKDTPKAALSESTYSRYYENESDNEKWLTVIYEKPEEFVIAEKEYNEKNSALLNEIEILQSKRDTLVMRVKLAPDKRLEVLISEIDDMGDISLMDSKLLLLGKEENQKLLG